jgi:hypothetical protein
VQIKVLETRPSEEEMSGGEYGVIVGALGDERLIGGRGGRRVVAGAAGCMAAVMVDMGDAHRIVDATGEPTASWLVAHVDDSSPCRVELIADGPPLR